MGATLGMASFSWVGLWGMPVRPWGTPVCIDVKMVGSTGSFKATVFSVK